MKILLEYKQRKEREDDQLRLQGGYQMASMPLKRSCETVDGQNEGVTSSGGGSAVKD